MSHDIIPFGPCRNNWFCCTYREDVLPFERIVDTFLFCHDVGVETLRSHSQVVEHGCLFGGRKLRNMIHTPRRPPNSYHSLSHLAPSFTTVIMTTSPASLYVQNWGLRGTWSELGALNALCQEPSPHTEVQLCSHLCLVLFNHCWLWKSPRTCSPWKGLTSFLAGNVWRKLYFLTLQPRTMAYKLSCNNQKGEHKGITYAECCVECAAQKPWCHLLSAPLPVHASECSCTWAPEYSTAKAQKAPIISPAYMFEEVEVSQLNAKQDLQGLSPGLRRFSFLLTLFQEWVFGNDCTWTTMQLISLTSHAAPLWQNPFYYFFLKAPNRQKTIQLRNIINVFERSLVAVHYAHWFPEASRPWEPINPRH